MNARRPDGRVGGTLILGAHVHSRVSDDAADVELALTLLAHLEHGELSVKAVMDRIEMITTAPETQRRILDRAVERGIVTREDGRIEPVSTGTYVNFQQDVIVKTGEFSCRRCGASLSNGHFVNFDDGELGPFGSTCIRKVLGRE